MSINDRILDFFNEVKNTYILKISIHLVKMSFSDNSNLTADDYLTSILKKLYSKKVKL